MGKLGSGKAGGSGGFGERPVELGVENQGGCNFCHEADRSLDTKPTKVKARQMIELVNEMGPGLVSETARRGIS